MTDSNAIKPRHSKRVTDCIDLMMAKKHGQMTDSNATELQKLLDALEGCCETCDHSRCVTQFAYRCGHDFMHYDASGMTRNKCPHWEPAMALSRLYGVSRCAPTPEYIRQHAMERAKWKGVA